MLNLDKALIFGMAISAKRKGFPKNRRAVHFFTKKVWVKTATWLEWEEGLAFPGRHQFGAIASALGMNLDELTLFWTTSTEADKAMFDAYYGTKIKPKAVVVHPDCDVFIGSTGPKNGKAHSGSAYHQ